jgi:ActR/RegA family two-component response regulator
MPMSVRSDAVAISFMRSPQWAVEVRADLMMEGGRSYHADVHRMGHLMCRITLSGTFASDATAVQALELRLCNWIADYEARDHMVSNAGSCLLAAP